MLVIDSVPGSKALTSLSVDRHTHTHTLGLGVIAWCLRISSSHSRQCDRLSRRLPSRLPPLPLSLSLSLSAGHCSLRMTSQHCSFNALHCGLSETETLLQTPPRRCRCVSSTQCSLTSLDQCWQTCLDFLLHFTGGWGD